MPLATPVVVSVSASPSHTFSKMTRASIELMEGLGVAGDAHAGVTVKHRSRVARDPTQPNLRQVHLIHAELHDELAGSGFSIAPGELGENITTRGVQLLDLPTGAVLYIGESAAVEITGLRNPCVQIDNHAKGLLAEVASKAPDGSVVRKTGVMGVVRAGGMVKPGDSIRVKLPDPPGVPLQVV